MRNFDTEVQFLKYRVLKSVSRRAFNGTLLKELPNIPNEIIPEGMQKRIDERCLSDEYLFRKMELKSELKALEYKTYNKEKVKNIK